MYILFRSIYYPTLSIDRNSYLSPGQATSCCRTSPSASSRDPLVRTPPDHILFNYSQLAYGNASSLGSLYKGNSATVISIYLLC